MSKLFNKPAKTLLVALSWIPVYLTVTNHVFFVGKIKGRSMSPTLENHDWVLIWKWNCHSMSNYNREDVVFFKSPMNPKIVFCKRVKGVQHDSITTRPVSQVDSQKTQPPAVEYSSKKQRNLVHIPRNHLWCEGDNVFHSVDSNNFGPISTGLCVGKVTHVIWPPSRWGTDLNQFQGRGDVRLSR